MFERILVRAGASAAFTLACAVFSTGASAAGPQLVTNGGFETGSFSGWTTAGTVDPNTFYVDGFGPHNGNYSAFFGGIDVPDTLSQTLATTAGTHYTVSFYLDSEFTSFDSAAFTGSFGSTTFLTLTDADDDFTFKPFSFDLVATGASTVLKFSGFNDAYYYTLDDVSVTAVTAAVPEPSTYALMVLGLAGMGAAARKRRRTR